MTDIRPGLCSVTLRSSSIEEVVETAHAAGLQGIEWGGDVHVPPGDLEAASRARRACENLGLDVPSFGSYLGARPGQEPSAVIDTTLELGAANIRVWAGSTASADCDAPTRAETTSAIARWCDLAADHQLTVSLEYHSGSLTDTAESACRLLDEVDRPNLWSYWQPRDGDAGRRDLDELTAIKGRLSHLHVFWWHHFLERFPLRDGDHFWPEALRQAAEPDAWTGDRWAFLEFVRGDDPVQLQQDAVALRKWLDQIETRQV